MQLLVSRAVIWDQLLIVEAQGSRLSSVHWNGVAETKIVIRVLVSSEHLFLQIFLWALV